MKLFIVILVIIAFSNNVYAQVFQGCSDEQKSELPLIQSKAFWKAKNSMIFIGKNPIYERWFGDWTQDREDIVRSNISKLVSGALLLRPNYSCHPQAGVSKQCTEGAYAYVYSETSSIHLCDSFWGMPEIGIDSKYGTILHELSHLHYVSDTEDHCYGAKGPDTCLELAVNNPDKAVQNADNYQYFFEESN